MTEKIKPLFNKVLIANRGEIAFRIIKTLQKMNIKTVAVYSEADTNSLHVQQADEAYFIGNSAVTESYLNIKNIIGAIRASGAEAVHPGYGFLSENPVFAEILYKEGITLIGPSANSIKDMGDKITAKKIAKEAGVSTVPGYMGVIDDLDEAVNIAQNIGFPVLVKAAAGGGGRGMRIVNSSDKIKAALISARLEADSCFSDNRVFIEKLIESPRHIEIQVLADKYGNIVCLGERECSIQRHHQKIIEEAPSAVIDEVTRQAMYKQCISLAKKTNYFSAGTVEFIVDQEKNFYFLEMNTRLQVEHCVTELITGIDIVEAMVRIAAGEKLNISQEDVKLNGHAIECRIYAEDPTRGFLPSSGRILEYSEPPKSKFIRIDSAIEAGSEVAIFYDPMIAKLCTYAENREEAIEHMKSALGSYIIRGISHNIRFLEAIISNNRFFESDINTNFINEEYPDGFIGAELTSDITENFLATALYIFIAEQKRASALKGQIDYQYNKIGTRWIVSIDNKYFPVLIKDVDGGLNIRHGNGRTFIRTNWQIGSKLFTGYVNGRYINVQIEHNKTIYKLTHAGVTVEASVRSNRVAELEAIMHDELDTENIDEIKAPLTGQITSVKVAKNQSVKEGDELITLTAMKMENVIISPRNGVVSSIYVKEGDQVNTGQTVIEFE